MPPMACRLSRTVRHFDDGMGEVRCDGYEGQMLLANYLRGSNFDIVELSYPERRPNNELDASFLLSPKDLASIVSYLEYALGMVEYLVLGRRVEKTCLAQTISPTRPCDSWFWRAPICAPPLLQRHGIEHDKPQYRR